MADNELAALWQLFSDVPVDNNDCIEISFHIWEAGTPKLDIWHWFDEKHSLGLAKGLMFA